MLFSRRRHNSIASAASSSASASVSISSAAGGTSTVQQPRGRGRPPGSKRLKEQQADAPPPPSLQGGDKAGPAGRTADRPPAAQQVLSPKTLHVATTGAVSATTANTDVEEVPDAFPSSAQKAASFPATGLEAARRVVAKMGKRLLRTHEAELLCQVRQWAPLRDLECVFDDLEAQKLRIFEK